MRLESNLSNDPMNGPMEVLPMRRGHFVYESGHHGDLWLDLELLCLWPDRVRPLAMELADRLSMLKIDTVCGPRVEGAYVALMVAEALEVQFCYTERVENAEASGLFPVEYRLPKVLAERLRGKNVAIVNDVINAGSAVRGTIESLEACGAKIGAIACLATLGSAAKELAAKQRVPLYSLTTIESKLWTPEECLLCREGVAIDR